mmetsp:Transcript_7075/g.16517  ORF Transcript_7075/g.16517 Transcript_7075/m.16517 type:complete len:225 (+) Transcript_7075:2701-3375(+)
MSLKALAPRHLQESTRIESMRILSRRKRPRNWKKTESKKTSRPKRRIWWPEPKCQLSPFQVCAKNQWESNPVFPRGKSRSKPRMPTLLPGWILATRAGVVGHPIPCSFVWIVGKPFIRFAPMLPFIQWKSPLRLDGDVRIAKFAKSLAFHQKTSKRCCFVKCAIEDFPWISSIPLLVLLLPAYGCAVSAWIVKSAETLWSRMGRKLPTGQGTHTCVIGAVAVMD